MLCVTLDMTEAIATRATPMNCITTINHVGAGIGLQTRTITRGAEADLVTEFIDFYCSRFLRRKKTRHLAVFIEPRIESGFPDIVFAHYEPVYSDSWNEARGQLEVADLKVLSYLIQARGAEGRDIVAKLGLPENRTMRSLENLLDARWIVRSGRLWQPRGLRSHFGLRRLEAIEAKIDAIGKAAGQALANTWFASHSYALTATATPRQATLDSLTRLGLGLYCRDRGFRKHLEPMARALPSSYASLLFNEWVGRAVTRHPAA